MNLADNLNNYFTQNTDVAELAMQEALEGYIPWRGDGKYVPSTFELWARPQGIEATMVNHYGGEDEGSTYYTVYKFTQGDDVVYLKFSGWYASYNGADYRDFQQVHPKEVTKVEYV